MATLKEVGRPERRQTDKRKMDSHATRPGIAVDYEAVCDKVLANCPKIIKRLAD